MTIYYGDHSEVTEDVLSYTDSDNDQSESDTEFTYIYSKSDTESDSDSPEIPMEVSTEIPMEVQATVVQAILPFTGVSTEWYAHALQNRLAKHNSSRDTIHQAIAVEKDDDGLISYVNRSEVEGTIERNVADLHKQISSASQTKRNHLEAILLVGKYFLSTGPLISTQELGAIYMRHKGITRR